jgi:hypothetical protein
MPQLETDPAIEVRSKKPWKGNRLEGAVESDFLFATLLSSNLLPFGQRRLSLVVLPLVESRNGERHLLDHSAAVRNGRSGLANWLRSADRIWKRHRKTSSDLLPRLDWLHNLTRQRPNGVLKVVYGKSGTHLCACVVDVAAVTEAGVIDLPVSGFIADDVTYYFETEDADEAHYLCAVLNAPLVDIAIKPHQTKGAFGAQSGKGQRDIHRRPFEILPIPPFNPNDRRHRELAGASQRCHNVVKVYLDGLDSSRREGPTGRLRTVMRGQLIEEELAEINSIASEILASESVDALAPQE